MMNYKEWKDKFGNIIVEVFNKCDLPDIQKLYIEKGYYIKETIYGFGDHYFFSIVLIEIPAEQGEQR